MAAACADKAKGPQTSTDRQTRLNNEVTYWAQVIKDAPSDLRDTAVATEAAAKKVAGGDNSAATSSIYLKGVLDFSDWAANNCKS